MSEKEKKAVDKVNKFVDVITVILPKYSTKIPEYCISEDDWISIKILLNLIEKQQKEIEDKQDEINVLEAQRDSIENQFEQAKAEIEKKDKMIDLMAKELVKAHKWFYSEFDNYTKEDFIKYFEKKSEEEK